MSAITPFPPPIRRYLGDFVARTRRVRLVRAAVLAAAYVLAWTLAAAVADRLIAMPTWARAVLLACEIAAAIGILARPLRDALGRGVDWVEASEQVERRQPSMRQRLVTIVSQSLAPPATRGSAQMLDALAREVSAEVESARAGRLVSWRGVARPAVAAVCLGLSVVGLWGVPWLGLPQLIGRQVRPFAAIPPVTTTQIQLTPEGANVRDHESLVVRAVVRHVGDGPLPQIHLRGAADRGPWDVTPMTAGQGDAYTFTIASVEQDQRFYVTAGDARTPVYEVRVLRRPAVAEFRVRYAYPAYTGRAPLSVHNTDGLIEAPRGTTAVVQVVATEPLASAALMMGSRRVPLAATSDPHARQATLTVEKDQSYELEMTTDRGVDGRGPKGMRVRAVPDRPPLVRMIQPGQDLRLSQRDVVSITYQALDDYGIAQLAVRAQVNGNPPVEYPRRIKGDPRRAEASAEVDLTGLKARVGDVVSVSIVATDRAGQNATSDVRHVLVSPRSIDMTTHQRLAELSQAAAYAKEWATQVAKAQEAVEQARRPGTPVPEGQVPAAVSHAGQVLGTAQEVGTALRQALLRAIVYSAGPKMSDALAMAVDAVTGQLDAAQRVDEAVAGRRGVDDAAAARMARTVAGAAQLATRVQQLADGDQAAAVMAERANLRERPAAAATTAPSDRAAQERRRQTIDRATQDVAAALTALGVDPKDPQVDARLQQRIDAAKILIDAARPVDFVAAATRWSTANRTREANPPHVDERLLAASQAEAVRPDAVLVAARDLQLAAHAATALVTAVESTHGKSADRAKETDQAFEQFPAALGAVRAWHDVQRRAARAGTAAEGRKVRDAAAALRKAADDARQKMIRWAAGPEASPDELAARSREMEELATSANAATEEKAFDQAAELDRQLAAGTGRPELADAAAAPRQIDKLSRNQEALADRTAAAEDDKQAAAFAGAQRDVADEIGRTQVDPWADPPTADSTEARQRATAAISRGQEKLASVPMQISNAQQLAAAVAETSSRLLAAQAEAAEAPPSRKEAARRVAAMIRSELAEAQQGLDAAIEPLSDRSADELADALRPFTPDTSLAVTVVEESLKEALADLRGALARAAEGADRAGVEVASQRVRDAVARAQDALRDAQNQVVERDPLVSARWFARAAADALSSAPPNKPSAVAHQRQTLEALSKAAADALRRSKNARLSQVPGYAPLYLPPVPGAWADPEGRSSGERFLQTLPGLREWGRFRDRPGEPLDAPVRESEPPGYGEALRTYFEVLGREDARPPTPEGK